MVSSSDTIAVAQSNIVSSSVSTVKIAPSPSDYPRSCAANWNPPVSVTCELDALQSLKDEWCRIPRESTSYEGYKSNRELIIADLHDFEIYRSLLKDNKRSLELTSLYLHNLKVTELSFNGFVSLGNVRHYVEEVSIQHTSVEGYGDDTDPSVTLFVQSSLAYTDKKVDIWYRLKKPASLYRRFHEPSIWVAQLAKHVVDFLESQPVRSVGLEVFRHYFHLWLTSRFCDDVFKLWHVAVRSATDFRVIVNAHIEFIHLQASNLPNSDGLLAHPLWGDCMVKGATSIKRQKEVVKVTLATPAVYRCFSHMYFGSKLKSMDPCNSVAQAQQLLKEKLKFPEDPITLGSKPRAWGLENVGPVKVGDVVAINPDDTKTTLWNKEDQEWLAYVQKIERTDSGLERLLVTWLYLPQHTNICGARYPFEKEIFFSNHCNCDSAASLFSSDIIRKYSVDWLPDKLDTPKDYFIRQTYLADKTAFVTWTRDHLTCTCQQANVDPIDKYHPGDTIYMTRSIRKQSEFLDPVIIHEVDKAARKVTVRKLLRLERDCKDLLGDMQRNEIAPNELVFTDEFEAIPVARLRRRCNVRFVPKGEVLRGNVPFPYNRRGCGDFWFFSTRLTSTINSRYLTCVEKLPDCINPGTDFDAKTSFEKLNGLSIFSGGGNLDRGLEEGGAVEFKTVVDFSAHAMHTQKANAQNPATMKLYQGSVDDYFCQLLSGQNDKFIAHVGEVQFIAAGSPCPGFSALQQNHLSDGSLRNASHISTFCSFVDIYRPQFGLLENVVRMASTRKGLEDQNVLSQLVSCLVSLGYQVNQFITDAWNVGSAQQRSRIFITIAAPGRTPIIQPCHTHSKRSEDTLSASLGKLPNGQRFGQREHYATPFAHVSALEVTADLPYIGNGNNQTCVEVPDHRICRATNTRDRGILERIPKSPAGSGYAEAHRLGLIPPSLQREKREVGKSYRRIKAAGLIPTITTYVNLQDARNGSIVHWSQDRPLSILEARRAQGYLDFEPIIGSLCEQWRIVGNGVDRKVSFALGLALRKAMANDSDQAPISSNRTSTVVSDQNEDLGYESSSTLSCIDVYIPPHQTVDIPQSSSTSVPSGHQFETEGLAEPKCTVDSLAPGVSLPLRGCGQCSTPFEKPVIENPQTAHQSRTRVESSERIEVSPLSSSSKPVPVHSKRGRKENTAEMDGSGSSTTPYAHEGPRKKARHDADHNATSASLSGLPDSTSIDGVKPAFTSSNRSQTSLSREPSERSRRTRHSGAAVEYEPKKWNAKPEKEFKRDR
ncbi:S-adenosyl-L-methionine-dependent methyltransferase [Dothidotthia symphoricarpi CBS 119687]|uniref:DNA (cytosine-5-)-methyltransferase n=1 Tax=Dothidotthia symphoricarpi CBS 119687 TaxID=1392245 RepID=A0A6A6AT50_9PLEO|nr:S-adenosyl-L-methionine-dependent methyltransferase [Dothidotthia symphoricarpi CBS 119687]KAF2134393.1 S-adenosyl-L-methionine-dependent methyltransferase [Dothidotthia symphoricarpi CBS 119687]